MNTTSIRLSNDNPGKGSPGLDDVQRATMNVVEDLNAEKTRMEEGRRIPLNILENFDAERTAPGLGLQAGT